MIHHVTCCHFIKKLPCTTDFCLLNVSKLKTFHCAFSFCHKENVLYFSFIKSNRPVRRVVTDRSWNLESSRKFRIYTYFFGCIQIFYKSSFYTLFSCTISKYIILNSFLGKKSFVKTLCTFFCSKNRAVIFPINCIIGNRCKV